MTTNPMIVRGIGLIVTVGIKAIQSPKAANRKKERTGASQSPFLSLWGRHARRAIKTMASTTMFPITAAHPLVGVNAMNPARAINDKMMMNQKKWNRCRYCLYKTPIEWKDRYEVYRGETPGAVDEIRRDRMTVTIKTAASGIKVRARENAAKKMASFESPILNW